MQRPSLASLRLHDILVLITVARHQSVSAAARELQATPSAVSKSVQRLEKQFDKPLFVRSSQGVMLSSEGLEIIPFLEQAVKALEQVAGGPRRSSRVLGLAAPTYMTAHFLPELVPRLDLRFRVFEYPPRLIPSLAAQNIFDLAITFQEIQLPGSWQSERVGEVRSGLFGSPRLAERLGTTELTEDDLREIPFVGPVLHLDGYFVPMDDGCPVPLSERIIGHEAPRLSVALTMAGASDHLAFGPAIGARRLLERGELVEFCVPAWHERSDALWNSVYVSFNIDRLTTSERKAATSTLRAFLSEIKTSLPPPAP